MHAMRQRRQAPPSSRTRADATADRLRSAIRGGTFAPGSLLPSVRDLARRWTLAINTVITAYRALEGEGLVMAVPRIGFRVLPPACPPALPRTPQAVDAPAPVNLCDLMTRAMSNREVPGMVSLGMAVPRPQLLPLPALCRQIRRIAQEEPEAVAIYDGPLGRIELRRAIARRLARAGAVVDPERILITNGAQEGLLLALRAVCPPGSCVAVESPAYHGLIQAIAALGLTCLEIPSSSTAGLSLDALRIALDDHPVAAVLCTATFSNPGGGSIPQEAQRELVALCTRRGIPLIDDDTYGDLAHDGQRPPACLAHAGDRGAHAGTVIHIGSWSKAIAPGLRLGFVFAGRWHAPVQMQKVVMNISTASLPQLAVAGLLDSGDFDRHWQRTAPRLRDNLLRCATMVRSSFPDGTRVSQPAGGLVLWIEMPDGVDTDRLYTDGIRARVCVAPGTLFSARRRYRHHLRLTGAWWDDDVAAGIARLGGLARHQLRTHAQAQR